MSNGVQEVGGPNSTDEAVNKISGGGKSRMSCSSQLTLFVKVVVSKNRL